MGLLLKRASHPQTLLSHRAKAQIKPLWSGWRTGAAKKRHVWLLCSCPLIFSWGNCGVSVMTHWTWKMCAALQALVALPWLFSSLMHRHKEDGCCIIWSDKWRAVWVGLLPGRCALAQDAWEFYLDRHWTGSISQILIHTSGLGALLERSVFTPSHKLSGCIVWKAQFASQVLGLELVHWLC